MAESNVCLLDRDLTLPDGCIFPLLQPVRPDSNIAGSAGVGTQFTPYRLC